MAECSIMVVDDEMLVALALADDLERSGYSVFGPFGNTEEALAALEATTPDAAFLDINLGNGDDSFPIADVLDARGVPFVFLTGYSEVMGPKSRFANVARVSKPIALDEALGALTRSVPSA